MSNIPANARWLQNGITVAGGNGLGTAINQFNIPMGLCIGDDQTMIVADQYNHRIIQWRMGDEYGQVIAGGNGEGNRLDQLKWPSDVLIDKETNSFIICDVGNRRVVRWSRRSGTTQGEILIDNIDGVGVAMDDERYLYVSDCKKHEVRRYQLGAKNGIVVAGGNGDGRGLNQLNVPRYLFVDREKNIYVSDFHNGRVMKWLKDAQEGIRVAGGEWLELGSTHLSLPNALFVDALGTVYVADSSNNRVMRWPEGAKRGTIIAGGNGPGTGANQLYYPVGLSFDIHNNLYIVDHGNDRVQCFPLE